MAKLTIASTAWHYRLANYGGLDEDYGQTDLCRYVWALVRGVLKAPGLVALGAVVGYLFVVVPMAAFLAWLLVGGFEPDTLLSVSFGVWGGVAVVAAVALFVEWRERRRYQYREPGVIASAYQGWKDKTCVLVEIK